MKKLMIIALVSTMFGLGAAAETTAVTETSTEKITSDMKIYIGDSLVSLPREIGSIQKHQNKVSKWAKITSKVAGIAGSAGMLGAVVGAHSGSVSGFQAGVAALSTASTVETAADATNFFAGMEGLDIVVPSAHSPMVIKAPGSDIRILFTTTSPKSPDEIVRVVKFEQDKKERRLQWVNYSYSLLSSKKAKKSGYKIFDWEKTGDNTYILTLSVSELTPGEYAVMTNDISNVMAIPTPTFRIE